MLNTDPAGDHARPSVAGSNRDRGSDPYPASHDGRAFAVMMAGYPLAWAVGLAPVFYLMTAIPMVLWLLRHRPLRFPPGTVFFALFLTIVGASSIQLNTFGRVAVYLLRTSWYVAAFITFLYLARHRGPRAQRTVVRSLVLLWALVVLGGYLAIVAPELQWSTPIARILPGALTENEFLRSLVTPRTSEIQIFRFEDITLYRPAAPFAYTNAWGSTFALTTPFALAAVHDRSIGIPRPILLPMLAASIFPFAVALNRGAWLTLAIGVGYGMVRLTVARRNLLPLVALTLAAGLIAGLALSAGVVDTAVEQLETRTADSNERRSSLFVETITETASSPLIGYGSTRPSIQDPDGPPLGTHGQLWAVLFAHGYLGAGLYVLFFLTAFLRRGSTDPVPHWAKVSLLIGLLQLPIYGHLPHQLFVMIGAVIISSWGRPVPTPA